MVWPTWRKKDLLAEGSAPASQISVSFDADGARYRLVGVSTGIWLASPFDHGAAGELGARLAQLHNEGYGLPALDDFLLPWADLDVILAHQELGAYRSALQLPEETTLRPRVTSRGSLREADFAVLIDGWLDGQGRPVQPTPQVQGRVLTQGRVRGLLPSKLHRLLGEIAKFHARPPAERTPADQEQAFGRIRQLAIASGCLLSDYVARTIVLTPDRLQLGLARRVEGEGQVVEVVPGFEDAPARWLELFDRLPLQASYDVPDGPSLTRVVLTPEVSAVLREIKGMPGRRAAGPRAQAFVRNPFAVLGDDAARVIDPLQFDAARTAAGIHLARFIPRVERGEFGEVHRVGLDVQGLDGQARDDLELWFAVVEDLQRFISKLDRGLDDGSQCLVWQAHEFELLGDAADHLATLQIWLREWQHPQLWTAAEVLELSHYSERIEGIGVEKPSLTPVIVRNDEGNQWFEDNVTIGVRIEGEAAQPPSFVPLTFAEIPTLQQAVETAQQAGAAQVLLPGLSRPVTLDNARAALGALAKVHEDLRQKRFQGGRPDGAQPLAQRLVVKTNWDSIDYSEARADALAMPADRQPVLPQALLPTVELKPHQQAGVAWLQHLWGQSPTNCRGTVLADDMGLGKTLQLLTFIVNCFEADPQLPPALVVAPVALLDNWRNELERFFEPGTLPLLTLYGETLRDLRVGKHELDDELKSQGITRLLRKGWVGPARLVLTTYETMRDLEFALASQSWSIMVCDEAQKIKTPAAMVTRSAKKQKVRFRIACTGTPVENSLADLWCLFDFVQPGMLGALSQFSRTYRQPIEAKTEEQAAKVEELRTLIRPQILQRQKSQVATDLPTPVEDDACKRLPMSAYQLQLYERALEDLRTRRDTDPSSQLQALMAIRQICSDPHGQAGADSLALPIDRLVNESPKMGWLVGVLKDLAAQQEQAHKVIVFCEFRRLQLLLQRVIAAFFGLAAPIVNGDTAADPRAEHNRQRLIDAFQAKLGFNVIILSPLAVGFGVNIQAANHVVHFTRTWNPAKEDQATARAYRIGQTRTVRIYYPGVVADSFPSFDVRLDALLARKRTLAADMLNGCSDLKASDFSDFG